jgi:hypothetical protein
MTVGMILILGIIGAILIAAIRFNSMPKGKARVVMLIISVIVIVILLVFLMGAMSAGITDLPVFRRGYAG